MKNLTKLAGLVLSFCMFLAVGVMGVLAVQTIGLEVGGRISFSAQGVKATIFQGEMTTGTLSDGSTKSDDVMKEVSITTAETSSDLTTKITNANWHNLNLLFNESGEATLKFSIKNDSEESSDELYVGISVSTGTQKTTNTVTITPSITERDIIYGGSTTDYTIDFKTANTEMDAGLTGFKITVNLSTLKTSEEYAEEGLRFETIDSSTARVIFSSSVYDLVVPAQVIIDDEIYTVASVASEYTYSRDYNDRPSVSSVILPNTITTIEASAFEGASISSIELPDSLEYIASGAFYACSLSSFRLPKNVSTIEDYALGMMQNCTSITVDPENTTFDSRDNCNAIVDSYGTIIAACVNTTFPPSVSGIGSVAFTDLTFDVLNLPETITYIDSNAFNNTFIQTLVINGNDAAGCMLSLDSGEVQKIYIKQGLSNNTIATYSGYIKQSETSQLNGITYDVYNYSY